MKRAENSEQRRRGLLPTKTETDGGLLTKEEFQRLSDVPPEIEWFANIENDNTRRSYRNDLGQFMAFVGINDPAAFRTIVY